MRVVLLTSDYHISANIGLKSFLDHPALKKHGIEIVGIVMAGQFSFGLKHLKRTARYFRKTDFFFLTKNILANIWKQMRIGVARYLFPNEKREYYAIDELTERHEIAFKKVGSVNSEEAVAFIREKKPELIVSCFLLEIIKKETLQIPEKGGINVHPALVQKHRGIFSAFWTLAKNWKKHGATVHYMTEKVDEGEVILQKHFFVYPSDTVYTINEKAARLGGKLLAKTVVNIKKNRVKRFCIKRIAKIFTIPAANDLKRFYAQGKSLFSTKDIFSL